MYSMQCDELSNGEELVHVRNLNVIKIESTSTIHTDFILKLH